MVDFTEASNLGVHAMAFIAAQDAESTVTLRRITDHLGCSGTHLAKVLAKLTREGYLKSSLGAAGGYRLQVTPEKTTVLEIVEAIDGPVSWASCLLGEPVCTPGSCVFQDLFDEMRERFTSYLAELTLADFRGFSG